ncbi:hypothetical protein [Acinetobacter higginsii]|nr:hypothetical protein [Acinetobacter higginsii]MDO3664903.1 hypothetical protein [Acinetobacter higginsii]
MMKKIEKENLQQNEDLKKAFKVALKKADIKTQGKTASRQGCTAAM